MRDPYLSSSSSSRPFGRLAAPLLRLLAGGLIAGLGIAVACSDDLESTGDRPEPPPIVQDGGLGTDAGGDSEISGCPSAPPRVGENCPRPEQVEETCRYESGTCMVDGGQYDKVEQYRCNMGVWIRWGDPGPCDTP